MRNFIAGVSLLAVACGGSPTAPTNGATLNLRITDTPFGEATAVLVTFDEVRVHLAGGEAWMPVPFIPVLDPPASRTCDLKKLEGGAQDVLGVGILDPGHYTQIRLIVASAALYFDPDTTTDHDACAPMIDLSAFDSEPMEISSGQVILNRQFDLTATDATTITLDFDAERSIRETPPGSDIWRMTPVIRVLSVQ